MNRTTTWLTLATAAALAALLTVDTRALPPPDAPLRVALEPAAMPLSSDTRAYTHDGFEALYAQELAQHMGRPLELVPVARPEQALQAGQVDLALVHRPAGTAWPADLTTLRTGQRSGLSVAMRTDTPVRHWSDLRGRTVCASGGNPRAQALAAALGGKALRLHTAPAQALVQVRTGECDAWLGEHAALQPLLRRDDWAKFSATLPPTEPSALTLVVASARTDLLRALRPAVAATGTEAQWQQRYATWAARVAFEVYLDQVGPDCH